MAKILITGGSGLIGKALTIWLMDRAYDVVHLGRKKATSKLVPSFTWDIEKQWIDPEALEGVDVIIHLAGANIGEKRWTTNRGKEILNSRILSGQLLLDQLQAHKHSIKAFISASAIGIYGSKTSEIVFDEASSPGNDFLANICREWENTADSFTSTGARVVKIRTGIVLSKSGGVLDRMIKPFKMRFGAVLGNGKQYMPWIHIDDLCGIYEKAIKDNLMEGAYNAVSPNTVNNKEFSKILSKVLKKPMYFPNAPGFLLKIVFGKMSVLLLEGSRVSAGEILKSGYIFKYSELEDAIINLQSEV